MDGTSIIDSTLTELDLTTAVQILPMGTRFLRDSTHKFVIRSGRHGSYFAIVSAQGYSATVLEAIAQQERMKQVLGADAGSVIEMPLATGTLDGRTYAVWTLRTPVSNNRVVRRIQRWQVLPSVLNWLDQIISLGAMESTAEEYAAPLAFLETFTELGGEFRKSCRQAREDFESGRVVPMHIPIHGDLWMGNLLFPGPGGPVPGNRHGFLLVDWGSAKAAGYPFIDLIKLASSANLSARRCRLELERQAKQLGCRATDARSYLLTGLADLAQNLNEMPRENFLRLCHSQVSYLERALRAL